MDCLKAFARSQFLHIGMEEVVHDIVETAFIAIGHRGHVPSRTQLFHSLL